MAMARKDDGDLSISLSDSVAKLVSADVVDKAAAARSIINNTVAYEKMKNM